MKNYSFFELWCGPAPLTAIKAGHIYIGYDTGFVFGEVNADRVTWICKKQGRPIFIDKMGARMTRSVGYNISTKTVGSTRRNVLDNDYKPEFEKTVTFHSYFFFNSRFGEF